MTTETRKLFETYPSVGTVVFDLPIAYVGSVLDELIEDVECAPRIQMFTVTPFNRRDVNTFASDAFKLAIHTVAVGLDAATQLRLVEFAELFHRKIEALIHECGDDA